MGSHGVILSLGVVWDVGSEVGEILQVEEVDTEGSTQEGRAREHGFEAERRSGPQRH